MQDKQFGKYYLQGSCGSGGMGTVYRARDMDLNRLVALKVVHPHLASKPNFYDRFMVEARLVAHLNHPNIIDIFDISSTRDPLYFVMPYYPGNLKLYLGRQPDKRLAPAQATALCTQIAHALHYAHKENIIHGDVKPENILISISEHLPPDQQAVQAILADFGLARLLEDSEEQTTPVFMGSWAYMAPERMDDEDILDPRSDVYALGATLYQLLAGKPPFQINSLADALRKHIHAPVPLEPVAHISEDLKEILLRALAKTPEERFQSCLEMARALEALDSGLLGRAVVQPTAADAVVVLTRPQAAEPDDARTEMITMGAETTQDLGSRGYSKNNYISINQIASQHFPLGEQEIIRIGRDENNDIVLPSKNVTEAHATLRRTAAGWEVRDLDSTNGVYIDNDRLLPDQEEVWKPHQKLRIGPYTLELHTLTGSAAVELPQVVAGIEPSAVLDDLQPGQEYIARIRLRNQGTARDYLKISMESDLSQSWYRLPQDGLPLAPNEEQIVPIYFTPPPNQAAGSYPYRLKIESLRAGQAPLTIQGQLNIKTQAHFDIEVYPTNIINKGSCKITIRNHGNVTDTYTIKSMFADNNQPQNVRFGVLPDNVIELPPERAVTANSSTGPSVNIPTVPQTSLGRRYLPWLFNNPLTQGYRQAQNTMRRGQQIQRDIGRLAGSWPSRSQRRKAQFSNALLQQITIPAGEGRDVEFLLETAQRPWQGNNTIQTIRLTVEDRITKEQQTAEVQLTTTPTVRRIPRWVGFLAWALVLLLICNICWFGVLPLTRQVDTALNLGLYPTATPVIAADLDKDGLSTADELLLGLNPQNPDSDGDGILDGQEGYPTATPLPGNLGFNIPVSATPLPTLRPTPVLISWDFVSESGDLLIIGDGEDNQPVQAIFAVSVPFDSAADISSAAMVFTEVEGSRQGDIQALGNFYLQVQVNDKPWGETLPFVPLASDTSRWQVSLTSEVLELMVQTEQIKFVLFSENPTDLDNSRDQLYLYTRATSNRAQWPVLLVNSRSQ